MPNNSILNYFQKKSDPKQQTVRNLTKSEPLTPKIEKLNKKLAENKLASPKASSLKSSPKNDSDKENSPQKKKRRRVIESDSEEEEDTKKLVAPSNFESKSEAQKSPKKPKLEATSPAKIQPKKTPEAPKIKKLKESNSISKSPKAEVDSNFKPIDIKDYNPAADNFRFKKSICWQPQAPIPYAAFCRTLFHIGDTTKRTLKSNILCNHFKAILHHNDKHELAVALSMCVNSVAPDFTGIELNLGPMILSKAIGEATGSKPNTVKEQAQKKCNGDLGDYAELCKKKQKQSFMKPKLLFCQHVFKKLQDISKISGDGAQSRKAAVIKEILVSCSQPYEALFLIRSLSGKLRIQLQHATLLQALAEACFSHFSKMQKDTSLDVKDCETRIKTAYAEYPDLELLAHTIVEHGWEEVNDHIHLTPGVPTKPMLAHPTKSISEVLDRFKDVGDFTCEWKYDGERAQIHIQESEKKGKPPKISIYSRNQENHTEKYPDVVERMVEILKHADCKVKGERVLRK